MRRFSGGGRKLEIEGVIGLFEAPYHRIPFMNPALSHIGLAHRTIDRNQSTSATVLLFGGMNRGNFPSGTIVSPLDGQTDVPPHWEDSETPDPLRLHDGVRPPVGFPILFAHFATKIEPGKPSPIQCDGASLVGPAGDRVEILVNSPSSDPELGGQAILILPRRPLKPHSVYRVSVAARDGAGRNISRTWKFRTAG